MNGRVMWRKLCQGVQPSTFAASCGSCGIENRPASIKIAKTLVDIQTSAKIIENIANFSSTNQGIALLLKPRDCKALLTRPTLSLNINLNWKPTSTGENIIGNIIIVRSIRWPRVTRLTRRARPRPRSISRLSAIVKNNMVLPKAAQKTPLFTAFS